jgi:hypothetical protein
MQIVILHYIFFSEHIYFQEYYIIYLYEQFSFEVKNIKNCFVSLKIIAKRESPFATIIVNDI